MRVIALSSAPKPRVAYTVRQKTDGFMVVDADGVVWSDAESEPAALLALGRVRRERAAYEFVEDRLRGIERALVAQRLVKTRAEARQVIADVLA